MVKIELAGGKRVVISNGLPEHDTGDFPNPHDPVPLAAQEIKLQMPAKPAPAGQTHPLNKWFFAGAVNGVPFDPSGPVLQRRDGKRLAVRHAASA